MHARLCQKSIHYLFLTPFTRLAEEGFADNDTGIGIKVKFMNSVNKNKQLTINIFIVNKENLI